MKVSSLLCFLFVALLLIGCVQMGKGKMSSDLVRPGILCPEAFKKTITRKLECKYLLFLPENYGQQKKLWPVILFLHGAGERGNDLEIVKKHGPPKVVMRQKDFPFIVVCPQCPIEQRWSSEMLINLLDDIVTRYDVDKERIYLTGLSMGGYGTWKLACEYPEYFAAIAPICGGGEPYLAGRLKETPIWAFHGAKDPVVPLEKSEEMVEAVKAQGGNAKLTVYPDAGHDSWTQTYNNQELYDWFREHSKSDKNK